MNSQRSNAWWIRCHDDHHAASEGARIVLDSFVRAGERDFAMGLSGGRLAPILFSEMVRQAALRRAPLGSCDFFWADERCVPADHAESNFRIARAKLLDPLQVPSQRIHRLLGELPPDRAADRANMDWAQWTDTRANSGAVLDVVLLGVGEDGHVASLFPENLDRDLPASEAFRAVVGPKPPPQRLTMGYPLLWEARFVIVVTAGSAKETVIQESLEGTQDTPLARVLRGRPGRPTTIVSCPG
jgi:6-phosphogluconolactonase